MAEKNENINVKEENNITENIEIEVKKDDKDLNESNIIDEGENRKNKDLEQENRVQIQISNKFQDIIETVEIINLIYKGETQKIERPISNIGEYGKYIKVVNECITEGTQILNNYKKISNDALDFESWAEISSSIMSIIRKVYVKYEDISEWNSQKRLELGIIIIYEVVFNHYYVLYYNDNLKEEDKKVIHYIFSEEGKLAIKCICNATVTLFSEIDENNDGEISCSEIKNCCCTPSKWCNVLSACLPKKKNKNK